MDTILEMRGIQKSFGAVKALNNVNLKVRQGEIHAICGENGAGKSTLMKILSGVYPHGSYSGDVLYDGQERAFADISDSEAVGIIIIHQELALVPMLSITENIYLGNEQSKRGVIDWQVSRAKAKALLAKVGLSDSPDSPVGTLGIGKQQLIEIAKALSKEVRLLILDEPTASLNEKDSDTLLSLLLELKSRGVTSIIISHKLNEISRVADGITVIRDGSTVDALDCKAESVSEDRIIKAMVGREMSDRYPPRTPNIGEVIFEVKDWRVRHPTQRDRAVIKGVNLEARKGEIVGIAGLMGSGRTELAMSVFGGTYGQDITGQVLMHGKQVDVSSVQKAIKAGIAYVTEDRKGNGLLLDDSIKRNITLANLIRGLQIWCRRRARGDKGCDRFSKEASNPRSRRDPRGGQPVGWQPAEGGAEQVAVLRTRGLILDEPTRGIDVGAKYEIYNIINQVVAAGNCGHDFLGNARTSWHVDRCMS